MTRFGRRSLSVGGREELQALLNWGRQLRSPQAPAVREWLARELLRVRDKTGRLAPLAPNCVQQEFERRAGGHDIVLKARQMGITTWMAARFFLETITIPGTVTVLVAHDQDAAEAIFRIASRFLANLPERAGLREALETSRANVRQMIFPWLDSEYRVESAADRSAGRGLTIRNLHASEVARWPGDGREILAGLRAAVVPEGKIVLESTANGAAGCFYDEWQRAPESGYVRHFFPWWQEASYVRPEIEPGELTEEERALIGRHGLQRAQIAFRRDVRAQFGRLGRQEFAEDAESCFLASGECFFELEAVERQLSQASHPIEVADNERLLVWWPPRKGRAYVIGVDPAGGGVHGDYACAQVVECRSGMQCAELHGHFTPRELAQRIVALAKRYHSAMLAIERNNHGHAVLAYITAEERYDRLYECRGQQGWLTNAVTRPGMLASLAAMMAAQPELFHSPRLLRECRTFVRHADGSARAAAGAHDDCVLAMAIAQAVRDSRNGNGDFSSLPN